MKGGSRFRHPEFARLRGVDYAETPIGPTTSFRKPWSRPGAISRSFTEGTNLTAWLFTILRNIYYSDYRKRRRETADPDGLMAGTNGRAGRAARAHGFPRFSRRVAKIAARSARGAHSGRRVRLSYEEAAANLRLRAGHDEKPRQSRAQSARRTAGAATPSARGGTTSASSARADVD